MGIVQNQRHGTEMAVVVDFDGCHFHHAIFKQMSLQRAIEIHGNIITDVNKIKFGEFGRIEIDSSTDLCTKQPEKHADVGRPGEQIKKKGGGEIIK